MNTGVGLCKLHVETLSSEKKNHGRKAERQKYKKAAENNMGRVRCKHRKENRPLQESQQKHSRKHKENVIEKIWPVALKKIHYLSMLHLKPASNWDIVSWYLKFLQATISY